MYVDVSIFVCVCVCCICHSVLWLHRLFLVLNCLTCIWEIPVWSLCTNPIQLSRDLIFFPPFSRQILAWYHKTDLIYPFLSTELHHT